ncbi:MAG: hypothetical protein AAF629_04610 [Chloroflexota bacterium]
MRFQRHSLTRSHLRKIKTDTAVLHQAPQVEPSLNLKPHRKASRLLTVAIVAAILLFFIPIQINLVLHLTQPTADFSLRSSEIRMPFGITPVQATGGLTITRQVSSVLVDQGDLFTYTLQIQNNTGVTLTDIIVTDTVPAGTTCQTASSPPLWVTGCSTDTIFWRLLDIPFPGSEFFLPDDGQATLSYVVQTDVPLADQQMIVNAANTYGTSAYELNNSANAFADMGLASITTTVNAPTWIISKTVTPDTVIVPGETLTYRITITNIGSADTSGVYTISDVFPPHTTNTANPDSGIIIDDTIRWVRNSGLAAGAAETYEYTVQVTNPLTNGTVLTNATYSVTGGQVLTDAIGAPIAVTVTSTPTLSLSKVADRATVDPSGQIMYTITYANTGTDISRNIVISDTLPPEATYISSTPFDLQNGTTYQWRVSELSPADGDQVITITVSVPAILGAGQRITNTATITDDYGNLEVDTAAVTANSNPTFALSIRDNPDPVIAGTSLRYTLDITNTGSATATNLLITNTLDALLTFVDATPTPDGASVDPDYGFALGSLGPGMTTTVVLSATVSPLAPHLGTVMNTITLASDQTAPAAVIETTTVSGTNFSLSKTASPATTVRAGDFVTYTIHYANNSPIPVTNLRITDTLPVSITDVLTGISIDAPDVTVVSSVLPTLTFTQASLINESGTITVVGQVMTSPWTIAPITITNAVRAGFTEVSTIFTDTVSVQVIPDVPAIVTALQATPNPAIINSPVLITATLTDQYGNPVADGEAISFSTTVGTIAPTVTANGQATSTLMVTTPGTTTVQVNTAGISGPSVEITYRAAFLGLQKTVDQTLAQRNDTLHYTLTVTNSGTTTATNLTVTDTLPVDVTFINASVAPNNSTPPAYTFLLPDLGVGLTNTIHITAVVNADALDQTDLVNVARASSTETETVAQAMVTTTVESPDLSVSLAVAPTNVVAGEWLTYTITYTSQGAIPVSGLRITQTLPTSLTNHTLLLSSGDASGMVISATTLIISRGLAFLGTEHVTVTARVAPTAWPSIPLALTSPLTATISGHPDTETESATITVSSGAPVTLTLVPTPTVTAAGNNSTLIASVTDQYGNPIVDGQTITFTTNLTDVIFSPSNVATSSGGIGSLMATSPGGGVAVFTATMPGLSHSTVVTFSAPGLAISHTSDRLNGPSNSQVVYTILVTNTGATPLADVWIQEFLGGGLSFVDSNPAPTVSTNPVYRYQIASLAAGMTQTVMVTSTIDPGPNGLFLEATASVTATDLPTPISSRVEIQRVEMMLTLSKAAHTTVVQAGDMVTYTITYANDTHLTALPVTFRDIQLTDSLPTELQQITFVDSGEAVLVGGSGNIAAGLVFTRDMILPAQSGIITVVAQVITNPWPVQGMNFTNQVSALTDLSPTAQTADVTVLGRPAQPATLTLTASTQSTLINTPVTITATVSDQYGNLAYDNTVVDFGAFGQATTVNGLATRVISSSVQGTLMVTATAGTALDNLTININEPVSVEPTSVFFPAMLKTSAQVSDIDLVVDNITISPATPSTDIPVVISVTIRNAGTETASRFWLDLYLTDALVTPDVNQLWNTFSDSGVAWIVPELAGGESIVLTNLRPNDYSNVSNCDNYSSFTPTEADGCTWPTNGHQFTQSGSYYVTALIDSFDEDTELGDGNIVELDEGNNVYQMSTPITVTGSSKADDASRSRSHRNDSIPGRLRLPLITETE